MSVHFRSMLFAPGNQPRKIEKAFSTEADVVCIDLEDAVPNAQKAAARIQIVEALRTARSIPFYVRINALDTPHCFSDVEAMVTRGLSGLVVPMIESASQLWTIDWLVGQLETRHGLEKGSLDIIPVIETARGVVRLEEICRSGTRVRRLSFGAWDFTLDTGIAYTPEEQHIADARNRVVLHSRSAGLAAPIDTSYPVLGDIDGLARSSRTAKAMGFQGKACIHPEQVAPVNEAFSPNEDELREAQALVAGFEDAEAAGSASVRINGRFVDYPIYKKAKALLASQKQR
jgi:citrate lyase subunit beta/citryl-CoA lyase